MCLASHRADLGSLSLPIRQRILLFRERLSLVRLLPAWIGRTRPNAGTMAPTQWRAESHRIRAADLQSASLRVQFRCSNGPTFRKCATSRNRRSLYVSPTLFRPAVDECASIGVQPRPYATSPGGTPFSYAPQLISRTHTMATTPVIAHSSVSVRICDKRSWDAAGTASRRRTCLTNLCATFSVTCSPNA